MKHLYLVLSLMTVIVLMSCKDSGTNNEEDKEQIAFDNIKGDWIHYKSIETKIKKKDGVVIDSVTDTLYFSLNGANSELPQSMIHLKDKRLWDFSSSSPDAPEQHDITHISDSTISLNDEIYTFHYQLEGDSLSIVNGIFLSSLNNRNSHDEIIEIEPIWVFTMLEAFYKRYDGTVPPIEWQ